MDTTLVSLRTAQARASQLADLPTIRRLAEIAETDREQNARYRVVRSEIVGVRRVGQVIACGLEYSDARRVEQNMNSRLVAEHPDKTSWTRPMAFVQMEPRTRMVEVPAGYMTEVLADAGSVAIAA